MEDFKAAQQLFSDYQSNGSHSTLRDSLDILVDIIKEQGLDTHKATNFKNRIGQHVDKLLNDLLDKSGVTEFGKNLTSDAQFDFFRDSLNKEDIGLFASFFSK